MRASITDNDLAAPPGSVLEGAGTASTGTGVGLKDNSSMSQMHESYPGGSMSQSIVASTEESSVASSIIGFGSEASKHRYVSLSRSLSFLLFSLSPSY